MTATASRARKPHTRKCRRCAGTGWWSHEQGRGCFGCGGRQGAPGSGVTIVGAPPNYTLNMHVTLQEAAEIIGEYGCWGAAGFTDHSGFRDLNCGFTVHLMNGLCLRVVADDTVRYWE